jgi:hypothetical protein
MRQILLHRAGRSRLRLNAARYHYYTWPSSASPSRSC